MTKILIGDDDVNFMETCATFLELDGFEVVRASTAADLFTAALNDEPDIVISDFDYGFGRSDAFPDGVAVGIALRGAGFSVPFVIHSGLYRPEAEAAGFPQWSKGDLPEMIDNIEELMQGSFDV